MSAATATTSIGRPGAGGDVAVPSAVAPTSIVNGVEHFEKELHFSTRPALPTPSKQRVSSSTDPSHNGQPINSSNASPARGLGDGGDGSTSHKALFERAVRRYYYQLSVGCGDSSCSHKLCRSCRAGPRLNHDAAAIMAVQLASRPRHFFCPRIPLNPVIPEDEAARGAPLQSVVGNGDDESLRLVEASRKLPSQSQPTSYAKCVSLEPSHTKRVSQPFLTTLLASGPFASMFRPSGGDASGMRRSRSTSELDNVHHGANLAAGRRPEVADADTERDVEYGTKRTLVPYDDGSALGLRLLSKIVVDVNDVSMGARSRSSADLPSLGAMTESLMQPPSVSTESTPMSSPELSRANTRDAKSRKGSPLKFTTNTEELGANPVFAEESHGTNGPLEPAIINRPQALTAMTLPLLKSLVAAYDDSNDTKPLTDRLRSLYSDSDALNRSFLAADEERTHPSGIDMSALRQASSIIAELLPREVFYMAIVEALEITLARLQMNLRKLNSASTHHCRQLLIILECPLWHDGAQSQEPLLRRLCLVLGGLKHNMERTLSRWLSRYESDGLRRIVNLFLSYLDTNFQPSTKIDDGLLSCINVLKMLYTANETAKPEPLLPIAAFYSDAATKKLNFKEEYRIWKRTTTTSKKQEPSRQGHASQPQPPSPQNIHYTTRLPTPIPEFSYFHHPFLFDPVSKMRIMHIDAMAQMSLEFEDAFVHQSLVLNAQKFLQASPGLAMLEQSLKDRSSPYLLLDLRRERLVEDVLEQLDKHKTELKKPLKIRFIGGGEEGMDQGGVQKEFFQILIDQLVDPSYGMFTYDDETRLCWLNGASLESEREFELVGTVLGLALYNGVMLDVRFPRVMYKRLLDEGPTLEDLKEGWPSLGRGLEQLLTWTDGDVADVFVRTFEISYEVYGQVKTFPLVHGGEDVLVTNENRKQYVDLFVRHFVVDSTRRQFAAFRKGFWRVCGGEALKMCRPSELELMICGTASTTLDFTQLQAGAEYDDGYHPTHPLIVAFWSVVHTDLTLLQKKALLNFVTASDRVPLNGLRNLTFVIQRNGPDSDRLPTALTCFGRLLLPEYEGREKLRRMLVTAVENAKGFGLV